MPKNKSKSESPVQQSPDSGSPSPSAPRSSIGWFFLKFLGASLLLYIAYMKFGFIYMKIVAWGTKPLLAIFGKKLIMENAMRVTEEISLNPAVYISLLVAVPEMTWKSRIRPAVIGVAILTLANILTVFLVFMSYYSGNETLWTGTEFFNLTINFFLPILLWFILVPVKNLLPALNRQA